MINPQNSGGHIVYSCKGIDSQGTWEGDRRFNEFYKLHEKLEQRWLGIPIPQLPKKKAIGNKDIKFINERRFYLERFLKKMSQFKFILDSKEFLCFSRPAVSDIEKQLNQLPKITTSDVVDRIRDATEIKEHMYDPVAKDGLDNQCKEFQHFAKQMLPVLKNMQKQIAGFMSNKTQSI